MHLPASAALVARLHDAGAVSSTNTELARLATTDPAAWPTPAVLVSDRQTAGKGRLGRTWTADPGHSLAISLLVRPVVPEHRLGWLSLAAGSAMTTALSGLGVDAHAKWPNDVLIGGRKVCGILAEVLPLPATGGDALPRGVVIGAGLNHAMPANALPVPTATSLAIEGGPTDPDVLLAAFLRRLLPLIDGFERAGGDPETSGLRAVVLASCATLGARVRVSLPNGSALAGEAVDIDPQGRIVVDTGSIAGTVACASGDVEHLRYE